MKAVMKSKKTKLTKIIVALTAVFAFVPANLSKANAYLARSDWKADESLLKEAEKQYAFPERITVFILNTEFGGYEDSSNIKDLYYYFASRSGYNDIPFHYLVGIGGSIFEGASDGPERAFSIGDSTNSINIAYIANNSNEDFNPFGLESLKEIILENANKYSVPIENITLKTLKFTFGERGKLENQSLAEPNEKYSASFAQIVEEVSLLYNPTPFAYSVELVSSTVPSGEFEIGSSIDIKIKVKNTGGTSIYSNAKTTLYLKKDGKEDSKYYDPETWDSRIQISLLADGERFAPGEEKEFTIKFIIPLYPEITESFALIAPDGSTVAGSKFDVTVKTKSSDKAILEVLDTEVGYLNVRKTPGLGEVITKVFPGQRFFILESQSGYYKIKVGDKEGWVVGTYVKIVK